MFENDRVFIAPDLDINNLYAQGLDDDEDASYSTQDNCKWYFKHL